MGVEQFERNIQSVAQLTSSENAEAIIQQVCNSDSPVKEISSSDADAIQQQICGGGKIFGSSSPDQDPGRRLGITPSPESGFSISTYILVLCLMPLLVILFLFLHPKFRSAPKKPLIPRYYEDNREEDVSHPQLRL